VFSAKRTKTNSGLGTTAFDEFDEEQAREDELEDLIEQELREEDPKYDTLPGEERAKRFMDRRRAKKKQEIFEKTKTDDVG
jgi:hypothetical protein